MKLTRPQMRAARAALRWTAADLANRSGVGASTIRRDEVAEPLDGESAMITANRKAIVDAFATAGVDVVDSEDGPLLVFRFAKSGVD